MSIKVLKTDRRRSLLATKLKDVELIPGHPNLDRGRLGSRRSRLSSRSGSIACRKISHFSSAVISDNQLIIMCHHN